MQDIIFINMNRKFLIFDMIEIDKINFDEVLETSVDTIRKSVDGTKAFIKWENVIPSFVNDLTTKSVIYSYDEFLGILNTEEWNPSLIISGTTN